MRRRFSIAPSRRWRDKKRSA